MIWPSISKILQYQYMNLSFDIEESSISNTTDIEEEASISKNLRYRVLQYRSTDLRYRSFFIYVCFDIEACRLRYRSTDLRYRSYISYQIPKLKHWPSISKVWYSLSSIYRYQVFLLQYRSLTRFQMNCTASELSIWNPATRTTQRYIVGQYMPCFFMYTSM